MRAAKALDGAEGGDKRFLSRVFARLRGGEHAKAEVVQRALVVLYEAIEGVEVPLGAAED
jgi:hypothetical protein